MPNLKFIVDGETKIDGNPGAWNDNPPAMLTDQLKAGAKHDPWMRAALMPLSEAISRAAVAQSGLRLPPVGGDWTLSVEYRDGDTVITVVTQGLLT